MSKSTFYFEGEDVQIPTDAFTGEKSTSGQQDLQRIGSLARAAGLKNIDALGTIFPMLQAHLFGRKLAYFHGKATRNSDISALKPGATAP